MPKILPNIKETIILEARKTLLEDGYSSFNMRDIAKQCSIGVGTLYNYFSNKDELVKEIFKDDWVSVVKFVKSLETKDGSLKMKINEIYLSINKFLENYIDVFMEMAYSSNQKKYHRLEIMKPIYTSLEVILTYHKSTGEIHSEISIDKLSHFIISNLLNLCRDKYITFDELYDCFKL